MPRVLVLPDHIASQIAAGEVVERPASVVKELVENAIDAGATQIEITIGASGRDIRVADNGCGMEAEDAVLAFQRHATSKLTCADDLWRLSSLGFRGEALPSIASIAKVTCFTRTETARTGCRLVVMDGRVTAVETGCAPGTVMEVTDLFYNVPARLSFLKKASTEYAHIHESVQCLAIAYPAVALHLTSNGVTALKTTGSGQVTQAAVESGLLTGDESLREISCADARAGMSVRGYVASPMHSRGDRRGILTIVNKRPVRCPLVYKALDYAFLDLIAKGRFPLAVLDIAIDARKVDVNIHPTKREIKYSNGNEAYMTILSAVTNALGKDRQEWRNYVGGTGSNNAGSPTVAEESPRHGHDGAYSPAAPSEPVVTGTPLDARADEESRHESLAAGKQLGFRDRLVYTPPIVAPAAVQERESGGPAEAPSLPHGWKVIGYLHNTYIVIESPAGLEIVEQHIAHERTLYERILTAQATPGRVSESCQRLILSVSLELSARQVAVLTQHAELLNKLGFEFEWNSGTAVECVQVPIELAHKNYAAVVQTLLDDLSQFDAANLELAATKSIACQSAIKNGMPLDSTQILKLLSDWLATPCNETCPHGRPIKLSLSAQKLFQMFHPA